MNDILNNPGTGFGNTHPGQNAGLQTPYNPTPPDNVGGGASGFRAIPLYWFPGQIPGDTGGGTPAPGDTQVGYPNSVAAPVAPTFTFAPSEPIVFDYIEAGASTTTVTEGINPPPMRIYLGAGASGPAATGSVRFTFRGRTYVDRAGSLYYGIDPITNAGTLGGHYNYIENVATLTDYPSSGGNTVTIVSLLTRYAEPGMDGVMFRTAGAPLRAGNFTIRATTRDGTELTATADINGTITGTNVKGHVDWNSGLTRVAFGAMVVAAGNESEPWYDAGLVDGSGNIWKPTQVDPSSVFYGAVAYRSVPVDPDLIGVDPVRMPTDGRVPGFRVGDVAVVSHTAVTTVASPVAGSTTDLGRERISFLEVFDADKTPIDSIYWSTDLDAGTLTWSDPLNLSAYTLPAYIRHRIQDVSQIVDLQINGDITLGSAVTHDYPSGTLVSAAVVYETTQARYSNLFDQQTYTAGQWSDTIVGAPATGTYNDTTYPIAVANNAAITQRWILRFRSPTTVDVIGEFVGQILSGVSITSDIAPINPATITGAVPAGLPYFTIDKDGFGSGWAADNVIRFDTTAATRPPWLARVVTPGTINVANDLVRINAYGNAH